MAAALKERFCQSFVQQLGKSLSKAHRSFPSATFERRVLDSEWEGRELKQRMAHIVEAMHHFLPPSFPAAVGVLHKAAPQHRGLAALVFPEYVGRYGLDHWEESMEELAFLTEYSSSELAVRPFIEKYPAKTLSRMLEWARDRNHHIRRLASEGCRPRLPWASRLADLQKDPTPALAILEELKGDSELYVRKSVANHLNDISKDHPELALSIARRWMKEKDTKVHWVVKHGMRTLLKQGDAKALALFGYGGETPAQVERLRVKKRCIAIGDDVEFECDLVLTKEAKVRIEYGVDFVKASGKPSRKIFKLGEKSYPAGKHALRKGHSFRNLTTRTHYPGKHTIAVLVNGVEQASTHFRLTK